MFAAEYVFGYLSLFSILGIFLLPVIVLRSMLYITVYEILLGLNNKHIFWVLLTLPIIIIYFSYTQGGSQSLWDEYILSELVNINVREVVAIKVALIGTIYVLKKELLSI